MGKQIANIYEIAKEAGVSIATVSRVVNNSAPVSEKSRKRVMDAVHKLNYVPSGTARSLSTSISNIVGVVIPDIGNPFFPALLQGISRVANEAGYFISLFNTDEDATREQQVLRSMRANRPRGIIITPVMEINSSTNQLLCEFEAMGIPVVLLDREIDNPLFDRVITSDDEGMYHAVCELVRLGHRKIAIITGPDDSRPGRERQKGYYRALRRHNIEVRSEYIRQGNYMLQPAYEQTLALLDLPEPPTAILASNNMTTYGCLKAFGERNIRIGEDIALVGFDDIEELKWMNYKLSTVARDVPNMGERAMQLLLQRFESERQSEEGTRVCLPTQLLLRGSEVLPVQK